MSGIPTEDDSLKIYYRKTGDMWIFAEASRAEFIAGIHAAIEKSKTWGEFRDRLPSDEYENDEYEKIVQGYVENGDDGIPPSPKDKFASETVPGYSDGDYPPWLQQEALSWFPCDLADKYEADSVINGTFLDIPDGDADAVAEDLRQRGYTVTKRMDLYFC